MGLRNEAVVNYLTRCQLVHGASAYGGMLNRASLRHCTTMLEDDVRAVLQVIIDHGADEDRVPLCYLPLRVGSASARTGNYRR